MTTDRAIPPHSRPGGARLSSQGGPLSPALRCALAIEVLRTRLDLELDLPFLEELLKKAQGNRLYRELAVQMIVAAGARILDAEENPKFYIEEITLEAAGLTSLLCWGCEPTH